MLSSLLHRVMHLYYIAPYAVNLLVMERSCCIQSRASFQGAGGGLGMRLYRSTQLYIGQPVTGYINT